jgi:hypothetical protein
VQVSNLRIIVKIKQTISINFFDNVYMSKYFIRRKKNWRNKKEREYKPTETELN